MMETVGDGLIQGSQCSAVTIIQKYLLEQQLAKKYRPAVTPCKVEVECEVDPYSAVCHEEENEGKEQGSERKEDKKCDVSVNNINNFNGTQTVSRSRRSIRLKPSRKYTYKQSHAIKEADELVVRGDCNQNSLVNDQSEKDKFWPLPVLVNLKVNKIPKPFACESCEKSFRCKSELVAHTLSHSGIKPVCKTCGNTFSTRSNLLKHQRLHTREQSFICKKCGKQFLKNVTLLRHERTHLGLKPYVCERCGKDFNQRCNLVAHERTHTGVKPFLCQICIEAFTNKRNLISHIEMHCK